MPKAHDPQAELGRLMNGEVRVDTLLITWSLTFAETAGRRRGGSDVLIQSLRLKAAKPTDDLTPGIPLARFDHVAREIRQAIENAIAVRNDPECGPINMQSWRQSPAEVDELIKELHLEVHRRKVKSEVASDDDVLSVKDLISKVGCSAVEINNLQRRGLIQPKRTVGGQRRFSQRDVARISELFDRLRRGDELPPPTGMGREGDLHRDSPADRSRIRHMTMLAVAHLYADAIERYPNRDHSVIEFIQSKMEWLTKDHIITMIRLARTKLDLPIYRRGRIPKSIRAKTNFGVAESAPEFLSLMNEVRELRSPVGRGWSHSDLAKISRTIDMESLFEAWLKFTDLDGKLATTKAYRDQISALRQSNRNRVIVVDETQRTEQLK